ncbi:MAG: hypothetical protein ACLGPL_01100 [Acidobacteriota bacterium]
MVHLKKILPIIVLILSITSFSDANEQVGSSPTANVTTTEKKNPISLSITSPRDGETFESEETVHVTGTVSHAEGLETGVRVNNYVFAPVYNGQFEVRGVPLPTSPPSYDVIITATDVKGNSRTETRKIGITRHNFDSGFGAQTSSGTAPLETELSAVGYRAPSFSCTGPGPVQWKKPASQKDLKEGEDQSEEELLEDPVINLTVEGVYHCTMEAKDKQGKTVSRTIPIVVYDKDKIDRMLRDKWETMRIKLSQGAVDDAVVYYRNSAKESYRQFFNSIRDQLPELAASMKELKLRKIEDFSAEYFVFSKTTWPDGSTSDGFTLTFSVDDDGVWKIDPF